MAFRPSTTNGGISVVSRKCAENVSHNVCRHIGNFYPRIAGTPIVVWEIPNEKIPSFCRIEQGVSDTGDECHHEIFDWERSDAEKTIKNVSVTDLEICIGEELRNLQIEDLPQ